MISVVADTDVSADVVVLRSAKSTFMVSSYKLMSGVDVQSNTAIGR
jgi:hypothetical protein